MRKAWFMVSATLTCFMLASLRILASSVPNFPPNPVGEKLYRGQLYNETLLPVVIIAFALLAGCIIHIISRRFHKPPNFNAASTPAEPGRPDRCARRV